MERRWDTTTTTLNSLTDTELNPRATTVRLGARLSRHQRFEILHIGERNRLNSVDVLRRQWLLLRYKTEIYRLPVRFLF